MQFPTVAREHADVVFIVAENNEGAVLEPGKVVEFSQTATDADQRASASLAAGTLCVASSINATNQGHVTTASNSTAVGAAYSNALIGWTLEDGPNATNATVQLRLL